MLIGIPVSTSKVQYFINQAYIDYIHSAGFEAIQISPKNDIVIAANICEGLILPGGIDIDPVYYDENNFSSFSVDPEKDAFERALLHEFIGRGKPIFGICRGLQLIAWEVMLHANTGTRLDFTQHIDDHSLANDLNLNRSVKSHSVVANLNVLYGKEGRNNRQVRIYVNSMHHQCLLYNIKKGAEDGDLSEIGFEILAHTKIGLDKKQAGVIIIEAFKTNWAGSRILAVQWHPEELEDNHLLSNFFENEERQDEIAEVQNAD